jgi:flagellar biosynthesis protein FlhB
MSDERTQPPSKRRRQLAREQGQVAHSPELTAAAGWLVAVVVLGMVGENLTRGFTKLVSGSLTQSGALVAEPAAVVSHVRELVVGLGWPLAAILAGFAAGALAAHHLQVRGLWATVLIVPTPARLWAYSHGPGLAVRVERSAWSVVKGAVLLAVSAWAIRAGWSEILKLGSLEVPVLVHRVGQIVLGLAWVLAAVLMLLGLIDYGFCYRRIELMLRTTPQEQREDQRAMEGAPAVRSQRRRVALSWRGDSPELLSGASLLLNGTAGLTVVLGGGPPPKRITVRTAVRGAAGLRLRRSAESGKLRQIESADLARRLAHRPSSRSPIAAELIAELAAIWPNS